jgi:glycosyltransferase involved in cell wall biosynthesis
VSPTPIGVNLLWLVPGDVGGSEEYTVGLLTALAELDPPDLAVTLFVNGTFPEVYPELVEAWPTVVAPVSGRHRPARVVAESTWLAQQTRRRGLAAVHHAGGTLPSITPVPGLVTLHDLQPLSHPERFSLLKRTYIRSVVPRSLRRAAVVITLTRFTGDDAVARCGVDPARLRLVPSGIDPPGPLPGDVDVPAVLERHDLTGRRIVLFPAITYAHKNHETLIRAFSRLVDERPDLVLVLTGAPGPCEAQVTTAVRSYGLDTYVRRPGRVPARELEVLYRQASVLAFPSAYEGFGLPVLEAMNHGCPVVASTAGALPAVTGGAAVLVEPFDAPAWAEALAAVLDQASTADALAVAGQRRAREFAWSSSAEALADAYRAVVPAPGPDPSIPPSSESR